MTKSMPHIGEIISLTLMLLMIVALVAAQAETTVAEPQKPPATVLSVQPETEHFRLEDE